jgi:transposase
MAKRYRPVVRDQPFLFPPDMREWLPGGHPVWLVISVVDQLDTSAFHAGRRTGGAGAAGYDPDMLLMVLVWAYAHRVTSSRRIERLCQTDVAFRVICGGNLPDHVTVARFRAEFADAVAGFFTQVLVLCARLGMGQLGVVALDGMKITASAAKAANRTEVSLARLAADMVARHGRTDGAEDGLFGAGMRGDEPPGGGGWSPRQRGERIAAALADLRAERAAAERAETAKAERFRARQAAGRRTGPAPAQAAVALAEENVARRKAAQQARIGDWAQRNAVSPLPGSPPVPAGRYCRVREAEARLAAARTRAAEAARRAAEKEAARKGPGPVRNITDPHSRLMPVRGGGFIQGYNTQNVTSEDGLIIATELTCDTTDTEWFEPMLGHALDAATLITACQPGAAAPARQDLAGWPVGLFLADAGYLSEHNLAIAGPDRLIATGKTRDLAKAARNPGGTAGPPWASPAIAAMAARLATSDGITAYSQRGHIAETPHGHIKHNMGFRQLSMRGITKATAEWRFTTTVHNIFKAITTGHLTPQALAQLTSQPG